MRLTELFKIDGRPMVPPGEDMPVSYEDLDDSDSGRDEGGVMHRIVIRHKLGVWSFEYFAITNEEYKYMESLFGEKDDFQFTHPSRLDCDIPETHTAYRSKYGIAWHSAVTKDYRNYKFNIIQC